MTTAPAKPKAVAGDEALIDALQQPIGIFLGDRAVFDGLIDGILHGCYLGSLDRSLDCSLKLYQVNAFFFSDVRQSLSGP